MSEIDVVVEGFIATDPQQGTTQAGKPFLAVSVAHTERRKNQQGQWEDATDRDGQKLTTWAKATFWEDEAVAFADALVKGTFVVIRGQGRVTAYIDKSGAAKGQLEIQRPKIATVLRRPSHNGGSGGGWVSGAGAASSGGGNAPQAAESWGGLGDNPEPF